MLSLKEIQEMVYKEYVKNGYEKLWNSDFGQEDVYRINCLAELGLIATEVSEAMELIRKEKCTPQDMAFECADIIIRTLNFMSRMGLDADLAIRLKHEQNLRRGKLHRKRI